MGGKVQKSTGGSFRFVDLMIIVIFLSIAALGVNLFRLDLMNTIDMRNKEPVGTVIIKRNTVQRRHSDRVLWDRLAYESPVYIGDLIRVAEISAATLNVDTSSLDLNENTLIRIVLSPDGEGFQIILSEGTLSFTAGADSPGSRSVTLGLAGQEVRTGPGTVLSAAVDQDGASVRVSEGVAQFITDGRSREIPSGSAVVLSPDGTELREKAVVVTYPPPNARLLNSGREPLLVNFVWSRVNLQPDEMLRMEIAADSGFNQIFRIIENLDRQAEMFFDNGLWHWRLSFGDSVLGNGMLTVADGAGPRLTSPALNSLFRYRDEPPAINFQWTEMEEASFYILEVSSNHEFVNPQIRLQRTAAFYSDSSLGEGTWYWRVMPVFPRIFEGVSSFSPVAFFRIERSATETVSGEQVSLEDWLASVAPSTVDFPPDVPPHLIPAEWIRQPEPEPEPKPEPEPVALVSPELRLTLPANDARVDGLTALRQQTVFRWESSAQVASSRFVLSRNANPFQGRPAVEIQNPGRTIRVDRLGEGTWYWTIEAQTAEGLTIRAPSPRRIQVTPVPLLPAPLNPQPASGHRFDIEELRSLRNITFNWSAVRGANAYIFTLFQQTAEGRRQIIRTEPETRSSYTLNNLRLLDRGTFVWQVEAVSRGRGGAVEQRGRIGEFTFIMDFPSVGPIEIEETGILYGNQ
jgi:hypothetical protein